MDATDKPFVIEKRRVYEAYKAVMSSKGGAGLDGPDEGPRSGTR
jgi:RNA-directed DNA polymerase